MRPFALKRRDLDFPDAPGDTGLRAVLTIAVPCREDIDDRQRFYFVEGYWRPESVIRAMLLGQGYHVDDEVKAFQTVIKKPEVK